MPTSAGLCATCHAPASLRCSGCHNIAYCGKQHQKEDWARHRDVCRAYEVKTSVQLGRHLVAARDLLVDDVIVCEAPLALGPRHHDAVPASCPGCLRALNPNVDVRCSQCMWPVCNEGCPGLTDIGRHGTECKLFKALATALQGCRPEIILPLRCLLLQKRSPQKWKLLEEMEHHVDAKVVDSQSNDNLNFLENAVLKPLANTAPGIIPDCSLQTVKKIFSLLDVNALELTAPHAGPLAAVYAVTSLLEHSCLPNTRLSFEAPPAPGQENTGNRDWRGRVTVRAARNITKGEHLSTMYTHALWSTVARQEHLMAIKNFRCSCPRCLDPRELGTDVGTLKCVTCDGWILPVNTRKIESSEWKCNGCAASLTAQEVRHLVDCIASEVETVADRREQHPTVQTLEELLAKLQTLLHPHHQHCLTVQHLLLQAYGAEPGKGGITALKDAELERKAALSRDMLSVILQLDPPLARVALYAAVCFLELERADIEIMKRKVASAEWNTDQVIRAIIDCRALLRRALNVLRAEPRGSPGARVAALAEADDVAIVSWATRKGLKLPEE